jgi:hypothetical protein
MTFLFEEFIQIRQCVFIYWRPIHSYRDSRRRGAVVITIFQQHGLPPLEFNELAIKPKFVDKDTLLSRISESHPNRVKSACRDLDIYDPFAECVVAFYCRNALQNTYRTLHFPYSVEQLQTLGQFRTEQ